MRIAKTKQTRRKREAGRKATRRSTPPFSPLMAMMGGLSQKEQAEQNSKSAPFIEYMDDEKIKNNDEMGELLKLIQNKEFDGNAINPSTGNTLLGTLLYYFNHKTPENIENLVECINELLNKPNIHVDKENKKGVSIIDMVVGYDNFAKVFEKSRAKKAIEGAIQSISNEDVKTGLLKQINSDKISLNGIISMIQSSHDLKTKYKDDKVFRSEIEQLLHIINANTTNLSANQIYIFNKLFCLQNDDEKIRMCNNLLKKLIGRTQEISDVKIAFDDNDNNNSESNASVNDANTQINDFFESFFKDEQLNKLDQKAENEMGSMILIKLIRTYQNQVNNKE